jgi:general secretion pathway protein D
MIRGGVTVRSVGLAVVVALALAGAGCAARLDYRSGLAEGKAGNWDVAVARLTRALKRDPDNIGYKIALDNARVQASRHHATLARKHLAAEELDQALEEFEIASNYDPSNKSAAGDLAVVRDRIRKREAERDRLANFDATKAAAAARPIMPVLSPRSPKPILLKWNDQSLQKLMETLGKLAGVNILFDEGFRDKNVSVNLNGVTFQEALDQITFINRLFYVVVDQNTLIVVQEGAAKRRAYDANILRTFYIQNAEIKEIETIVKTSLGSGPKVSSNPTLGAITVMGTPDEVALAERIIALNDKARGEVMVEVEIMEINRNVAREQGIELSNYEASVALSPTGNDSDFLDESQTISNVRAHLLSSLNLSDFLIRIPTTLFTRFLSSEDSVKILASPKLRAADGKKTTLKIVQKVPVPQAQVSFPGQGTGFSQSTLTYQDVGVTLDITPKVTAAGDITLEINAEFSLQGENRIVGVEGQQQEVPIFSTRSVSGLLRLRDGERSLIGGLVQEREAEQLKGILGVRNVPILNKLFSAHSKDRNETEIVISITPHLVRAPKIYADDLIATNVGTKELIRVPGARPPLFGASPEEVAAPAVTAPGTGATPGATIAPPIVGPPGTSTVVDPALRPASPLDATRPAPVVDEVMGTTTLDPPEGPAGSTPEASGAAPPAAVRANLTPPVATVRVGDTTTLGLVVMGAQGITAAEVIVSYDLSALEAVDVVPGPLLTMDGSSTGTEKNMEAGRVRVRFTRSVPASGSGVIATFTFRTLRSGLTAVKVEAFALSNPTGTVSPAVAGVAQVNVQ